MLEKLKGIKEKFDILTREIADPQVIADTKNWQKKVKEHSSLQPSMEEYEKKHHPERFRTVGLAARKNVELLARYGEELNAGWVISTDLQYNDKLTQLSPRTGRPEELCELICSDEVDVVLCAIVGTAGLPLVVEARTARKLHSCSEAIPRWCASSWAKVAG